MDIRELKEKVSNEIQNAICELGLRDILVLNKRWWADGTRNTNHPANGMFRDLFWWNVKIKDDLILKEEYQFYYSTILFMPYCVDNYVMDVVAQEIDFEHLVVSVPERLVGNLPYYGSAKGFRDSELYNVDFNTGNVHLPYSEKEWADEYNGDNLIKQLILCGATKHNGPRLADELVASWKHDVITYETSGKKIYVPKECYYPQIFDECEPGDDVKTLLRGLLLQVCNEDAIRTYHLRR